MNKKRLFIIFIVFIVSLVLTFSTIYVVGKYYKKNESSNVTTTEDFIFHASYDNNTYYIKPVAGETSIKTTLLNYIGDEVNDSDISVSLTLKKGDAIVDTDNVTLNKGSKVKQEVESNISSGLVTGEEYTLIIQTTSPYKKTITAKFIVSEVPADSFYSITDKGAYVEIELLIGINKPVNNIKINHGLNLSPDNTNEVMASWITVNEINEIDNSLILTNSKVTLIFFKTDSSVYKNVLKTGLVDTIVIEKE